MTNTIRCAMPCVPGNPFVPNPDGIDDWIRQKADTKRQEQINIGGNEFGCHICGTTDPGARTGKNISRLIRKCN